MSFDMTFSGHVGINHVWGYAEPGKKPTSPAQPGVMELLEHYRRHTDIYTPAEPVARTAVWRNPMSLHFVNTDTHLSVCVMEQTLFNHRIPFSIVMDGFINDEKLRLFDLLILPDVEFISDKQAATLTRFVEAGGSLLITEQSGIYNSEPRKRNTPALAHLFGGGLSAAGQEQVESGNFDPDQQFALQYRAGQPACGRFGKGRVAYLPKIHYVHPPKTFFSAYNVNYNGIDSRYWKEPYNAEEVLGALRG